MENIMRMREELWCLENLHTPEKPPESSRTRVYRWATECTKDDQYSFLFKFKPGKHYEAMRDHFMTLVGEAEIDLVHGMLEKYHHNYFDPKTGRPYSLSTLTNNDGLDYIDKDKIKKAHYKGKYYKQIKKNGFEYDYEMLGEIFNSSTATGKLSHASTPKPPNSDDEKQMEDDFIAKGVHISNSIDIDSDEHVQRSDEKRNRMVLQASVMGKKQEV
ncbi:hypothetical protein PIB30_034695 [Stylosanthes scabra]|uniref:Uncharacterized protein n=1 Tax=Stylosanthes scabra TaxID=79078 RepID=A0ABU6TCM1_9FABA|nr:hypothetical protein [Stylosanthes scabra]